MKKDICNLSAQGRKVRRIIGILGFVAASWAAILFVLIKNNSTTFGVNTDALLAILLFISTLVGATGFIQVHYNFCAYLGMTGITEDEEGNLYSIKQNTHIQAKVLSLKIILYASIIAFCVTSVIYLIKIFI